VGHGTKKENPAEREGLEQRGIPPVGLLMVLLPKLLN
jgi:hypothetical protein